MNNKNYLQTPRGRFEITEMTEEELRQKGFSYYCTCGDYDIFTKGCFENYAVKRK